jgi:hypothetical protein
LISLNATFRPGEHPSWVREGAPLREMSKDMTDKQQNAVAVQPMTKNIPWANSNQTAEVRRVQDALEDDEVREALTLLHARGKNRRDELA